MAKQTTINIRVRTHDLLTLTACPELRRALAEKMGYHVEPHDNGWHLIYPDGHHPWVGDYDIYHTANDMWDYLLTDNQERYDVPLLDTSVDAALTMVTGDLRYSLHNEDYPNILCGIWLVGYEGDVDRHWIGGADQPALAIARAMLRYWQAQEAT